MGGDLPKVPRLDGHIVQQLHGMYRNDMIPMEDYSLNYVQCVMIAVYCRQSNRPICLTISVMYKQSRLCADRDTQQDS